MSSSSHHGIYGDTTGELYSAWLNRLAAKNNGGTSSTAAAASGNASPERARPVTLPHDVLQPLFNDVLLYPSKSQVFEMVQCARECSNQVRVRVDRLPFCMPNANQSLCVHFSFT